MLKLWQSVRLLVPVIAVMLLCSSFVPNATTACKDIKACTCTRTQTVLTTATQDKAPAKKGRKSVLDADVLDHPLSFFQDSFAEEAESGVSEHYRTLMLTVKTLVASLLSTII
ncbi:hypothetical protein ACFSKU_17100 [Pontibacter silvestris]|uniref:Secreted protein n=1 Tax=Pontibacter silvestris TaxID=2305183 RepID=A0ABW4X3N6_9BACT|nr:hypothetical protein [Pontibacter silvestris]MCC9135742.1 hypothetical protein [Pontibacter silvestris]